jgi:class 3 adenylate cyclase
MENVQIPPDLIERHEREKTFISLEREQKNVTVLFIDMKGFSRMFKKHDEKAIFAIIDLYFRVLHSIVKRNNGIVYKFLGDGLMAVWGLPSPHKNDAYNAVRTAIEMRMGVFHLIPELVRIGAVPIEVGIGIGTGNITCGFVGPTTARDFTLVGACILKAAQLETITSDNRILIDCATANAVKPYSYLISRPSDARHPLLKNERVYELEGIYQQSNEFDSVRKHPRVIVAKAVGITQCSTNKRKVGMIRSVGEGGLGLELHDNKDFDLQIGEKTIIDSRGFRLLGLDQVKGIVIRKQEFQGEGTFRLKKWDIGIKMLDLPEKTKKTLDKAIVGKQLIETCDTDEE